MKRARGMWAFLIYLSWILVSVGALNWGLVEVFNFNLVDWLFISTLSIPFLASLIYILVGLAGALILIPGFLKMKIYIK